MAFAARFRIYSIVGYAVRITAVNASSWPGLPYPWLGGMDHIVVNIIVYLVKALGRSFTAAQIIILIGDAARIAITIIVCTVYPCAWKAIVII